MAKKKAKKVVKKKRVVYRTADGRFAAKSKSRVKKVAKKKTKHAIQQIRIKKRSKKKTTVQTTKKKKVKSKAKTKVKATKRKSIKKPRKERYLTKVPKRHFPKNLVPVFHVSSGDARLYSEDIKDAPTVYTISGHANKADPRFNVSEIFEKGFINHLNKSPYEANEVLVYRYGIILRPDTGVMTTSIENKIGEILREYPGASFHVIDEGNTFSLRVNLGSPISGELAGTVSEDLEANKSILSRIFNLVENTFGDSTWFAFWDSTENMEGSD